MDIMLKKNQNIFHQLKNYCLGLSIFYTVIAFLPQFNNQFYPPKLLVILFFTIIAFIFFTIDIVKRKKLIVILNYFSLLAFIFLFSQIISVIVSKAPFLSLFGYYKTEGLNFIYFGTAVIFVILISLLDNKKQPNFFNFFIAGTTISSLLVIYDHIINKISRPVGLEGHPIWSANIIALSFLILLIFYWPNLNQSTKKNTVIIKLLIFSIHLLALIFLDSSQVFLCLMVAITIFFGKKYYHYFKKKTLLLIISIIMLISSFFLTSLYLYKKEVFSLFKRKQEIIMVNKMFSDQFGFKNIKAVFFGNGQSTSGFYLLKYKDEKEPFDKEWLNNRALIHNQFLEVLWSNGIVGFFIWVLILIKALKIALKKNQLPSLSILTYFTLWQMFYILTPSALLFYLIFLGGFFEKETKNKIKIVFPKWLIIFPLSLIVIFSWLFYLTLMGEFFYSLNQNQKAARYQFWNEVFVQNNLDAVMAELKTCQRNLVVCNDLTLKSISDRILNLAQKKIFINPINPDNWNDLSIALFYHYYFYGKTDKKIFDEALKAVNYAFSLYPTNYYYYDTRGLLYLDKKDYQKAEADFLSLLKKNPQYLTTIRHIIELYKQTGNQKQKESYENYLNLKNVPQCLR
jgi:hypothetical protein